MTIFSDAQLCDLFKRRDQVEQILFDIANGKRPMLTQDEARELALKLGTPVPPAEIAAIAASEALLECIRQYVRDYHYALDCRKHGGVAADHLVHQIETLLGMPWLQGAELVQRTHAEGTTA